MHPVKKIVHERSKGLGVYSACTASPIVIEAVLEEAKRTGTPACIEATANQVNQFGGYTGMQPPDFYKMVCGIADKVGYPAESIILGGDHLGPLAWQSLPAEAAMRNAEELVRQYVQAGFTKIHIDTSMELSDDNWCGSPNECEIARRAVRLMKIADENSSRELVYIIGSEVPVPGGATKNDDEISVTAPEDFERTVEIFQRELDSEGLGRLWAQVAAVVVQPGVEFSDANVHEYSREKAKALTAALRRFDGLVFEGHSTDYQTPEKLREMAEDGIGILKVGPALTFKQREALLALSKIEAELGIKEPSNFADVLENAMLKNPSNWQKHYGGDPDERRIKRRYSYADRCRYYLAEPDVAKAIEALIYNLTRATLPLSIISQYMPLQYRQIREGILSPTPEGLIKSRIKECIGDYLYAIRSEHTN